MSAVNFYHPPIVCNHLRRKTPDTIRSSHFQAAGTGAQKLRIATARAIRAHAGRTRRGQVLSVRAADSPTEAKTKAVPAEVLSDDDLSNFNQCISRVVELGCTEEEATTAVERAFGWGSQLYWRGSKKNEVPDLEAVEANVQYVKEQMGKDSNFQKVLKGFPEFLALPLEDDCGQETKNLRKRSRLPW
ncbi:hypothetical protein CYMTET_24475 [Cymbomonas tetramitiformis]|uniref:Uncharacterized protein n=1 Tax=Cymbomonas tetramitiformis TaxID=36881 RepID=A0AAE0FW26_9CHLO|nr:hypothetical protein CYMTET_24475 [Cymbomonas tetramitiformis]